MPFKVMSTFSGMSMKNNKIKTVLHEFKEKKLRSGSKKVPIVQNRDQALAIALSEARKKGAKIPRKKSK